MMKRTLVNIISAQTIQNYLFIKELYQENDNLLFLHSSSLIAPQEWIIKTLVNNGCVKQDNQIISKELSEEDWISMCESIESCICEDVRYLVNLTGGTKYMSLAVQRVFEKHTNVDFYYMPFPKNVFLKPFTNERIPICSNVTIKEYMSAHNVEYKTKQITRNADYTRSFFWFFNNSFSDQDRQIIDKLRQFRNKGVKDLQALEEGTYVTSKGKANEKVYPKVSGLSSFLKKYSFSFDENKISSEDVQYLTGGWFEEYMYHLIIDNIKPDDIEIGVEILQKEGTNNNDLDVVFTKGNKLFVIECKTAISRTSEKSVEGMFKEIAYKAATIKATLLRLPSNSMICSLSDSDEKFKKVAKNMGIEYYDRSYFFNKEKLHIFLNEIIKKAY